jgi:uncharacterized cofD-like protein
MKNEPVRTSAATKYGIRPSDPLRVVSIGGGTGLSTLLKGLKHYVHPDAGGLAPVRSGKFPLLDLTAVVTVTDDGGSSGRLRRDFDILPPGDIRNCMVALSEDEALLGKLFQHRFDAGRGLKGHSFGNLFLAALTQVTGDFAGAVKLSSEVLAIAGRIFPSTAAKVSLRALLDDGTLVDGESEISRSACAIRSVNLIPRICHPLDETLDAIRNADLITLGPGSLYTSVIPNLLVRGIPKAIEESPALKACFVNLMWQPGETIGMRASDHVTAVLRHARRRVIDYVIVNTAPISQPLRRRYAEQQARPVENDLSNITEMGLDVAGFALLSEASKARHDPERTAAVAVQLAKKARRRRLRALFPSRG